MKLLAAVFGYFELTMPGPDGTSTTLNGRFTDLKAEKDGKRVYVHDHKSMPLPPPPAEVEESGRM